MKLALVHDAICYRAGGERVLLNMHRAFPKAPIYTSMYDSNNVFPEFWECDIRTSWFQKIAKNEGQYKQRFFPFAIWAMESLDLSDYDVILLSTTFCAKYIKVHKKALVIAYCFTPFRLAWNPISYSSYNISKGIKRSIFNIFINKLKQIDFKHAKRTNYFIAMTNETSQRIKNCYNFVSDIQIIPPSIDVSRYYISHEVSDFYLVVSRLETYKRVDLVIETFNKLKFKLKIVGKGTQKDKLRKIANKNIEFIEGLDDNALVDIYSKCKALIFPQHEDYGLTPLEANACGRPVICYNQGGVLETMKPYLNDSMISTAIFFEDQTIESLSDAILKFEKLNFDPVFIRDHAKNFDNELFIKNIYDFVHTKYNVIKKNV